ncbi:MAG: RNA-binding S4 domain-containing protein [Brevundimonas sp.]|uniref:RNA-binding S4 domain-containing protein n=1 Tax=Brevundimonas sp. TaxID=1871086 RepID=UPI0025BE2F03|nr:S4 domain-containing protein [Brevundimonas sp.]MBX3476859.1 RNA-binding S4 domain-containing protein [Brevundimonas sp.]
MALTAPTAASCRIDVWLWRARFAKTRGGAAALVEAGAVRLTHQGRQVRLDKPSRSVHLGDDLLIVQGGRLTEVRVQALGERRGPASEAHALYVATSQAEG